MFHFENTAIWTSEFSQCAGHQNRNAVSFKKSLSSWFSAVYPFQVLEDMFMRTYASSRVKRRGFIEKVNSRCSCWFPAAILVHQNGAPIWRLHTKLYKGAWNVSANNSETVGQKDLRLGQIVYILVFYNVSFSWLLPPDGFQFNFLLRDSGNDLYGHLIITDSWLCPWGKKAPTCFP